MITKIDVWARSSKAVFEMLRERGITGSILVNKKHGAKRVYQARFEGVL
jgi:hypothetical protein